MKGAGAGKAAKRAASGPARRPTPPQSRARATPPDPAPPLALSHPATILVGLVAAACVLFTVSYRIIDSDFWQHLLVGRTLWERHAIPRQHLWSWLSYGTPEVLASWLFCALVWPFQAVGGVVGLFAWRWITTLAVFGLSWSTARRIGARGLLPLVVMVWCALLYRGRSQVRPETLAAVLLALEIWILETRRHGGPDRRLWLVPIVVVWVNAHVSYFLAFIVLAIHLVGAGRVGTALGAPASRPTVDASSALGASATLDRLRSPWALVLLMGAAAFLNPFGWQALWQPFEYSLSLSREPLFRGIGELQPMNWTANARSGAWLMIGLWPLLLLWRWRRRGLDPVEALMCALATAYTLPSQRFIGVYAVAASPYLARDLEEWFAARRRPWGPRTPVLRALLAAAVCIVMGVPEAFNPVLVPGVAIDLKRFPLAACDFIERHGVRGRGFSHFRFVGYQAWRFWPDRERLPFMDIHQSGRREDRDAFALAFTDPASWPQLRDHYRLDYVVLDRRQRSGAGLLDVLDADTSWTPVLIDDGSALYVARRGRLAAVADSFGYRLLGGGAARLAALAGAAADSARRGWLRGELERAASQSVWNSIALGQLANLELMEGHPQEAGRHLEAALRVDPGLAGAHQRLGVVALWRNDPRRAIAEFERERELHGPQPGFDLGLGMAAEQAGDSLAAAVHYRRELELDPGNAAARARLEALGRAGR